MDPGMKVISKMIFRMATEESCKKTAMSMKVDGYQGRLMVMGDILIKVKGVILLVIGKITSKMDKDKKLGKMVLNTKASTRMAKNMDKVV